MDFEKEELAIVIISDFIDRPKAMGGRIVRIVPRTKKTVKT